jgi:hypothetical protein
VTVSTLWFAVSLIVVFLLGWSMGYGNGRAKGKVEVLEQELGLDANEGENQ